MIRRMFGGLLPAKKKVGQPVAPTGVGKNEISAVVELRATKARLDELREARRRETEAMNEKFARLQEARVRLRGLREARKKGNASIKEKVARLQETRARLDELREAVKGKGTHQLEQHEVERLFSRNPGKPGLYELHKSLSTEIIEKLMSQPEDELDALLGELLEALEDGA